MDLKEKRRGLLTAARAHVPHDGWSEAALLAAVLPSPKRLDVARPSAYVRSRQSWILAQMEQLGGVSYLDDLR